jgi:hypothetical protein
LRPPPHSLRTELFDGSFRLGGSDSYCYVNQAYDWASGRMFRALPIPLTLPFETSDLLQQPLGYRVAGQRTRSRRSARRACRC